MTEGEFSKIPSNETIKVDEVSSQIAESVENNLKMASLVEEKANKIAQQKLNGVLPKDFIEAAQKQTIIGVGVGLAESIIGTGVFFALGKNPVLAYVGTSLADRLVVEGGSYLYNVKKPEDSNLQNLTTTDWLVGQIPGINPVFFGGLKNWFNGVNELHKAKEAAMGPRVTLVGMAAAK